MEIKAVETVINTLAEKIDLLEWQLEQADKKNRELREENKALKGEQK